MSFRKHSALSTAVGVSFLGLISCSRPHWQDIPIQINPKKPLTASLGQDVEWSFEAFRGSRKLRIVAVSFNNLPLGVLRSTDANAITLKGKPLSRQIRNGLIEVTAFDEKACEEGYEQMKEYTAQQVRATGNTNVAIPTSPCKLTGGADFSNASPYMATGRFAWQFVDGPDVLSPEKYQAFVAENSFKTRRPIPRGVLAIPSNEAPHTVEVVLGACAALARKECGKSSDCLWGGTSCLSQSITGRKAAPSPKSGGPSAGSDSGASASGGIKQ